MIENMYTDLLKIKRHFPMQMHLQKTQALFNCYVSLILFVSHGHVEIEILLIVL